MRITDLHVNALPSLTLRPPIRREIPGLPLGGQRVSFMQSCPAMQDKLASLSCTQYSAVMTADSSLDIVANDLTAAIGRLLRRLRTEANPTELALSQMGVLARLEQGGPMTTADLARVELMKPQSMGVILASLEQEGLIERRPHPTNRRQILFSLTENGVVVRTSHRAMKRDWLVGALGRLDPADLKALIAATAIIRQVGDS